MRTLAAAIFLAIGAPALAGNDPLVFRSGFEAGEGVSPTGKWVSGYYVGYELGLQPVANLSFEGLTHLMVGAALPQADGSLATHFYIDDVQGPAWAQAAVDAAQAAGRKAVLMIGGAGTIAGWREAADDATRAAFVANLLALVDEYGVDGLDLDWEPIEAQDRAPLVALVQALRSARPALLLTLPVNIVNANFSDPQDEAAFYATVAPLLDQINLMSYGMGYDYDGWHSWFSSPLDGEAPNTPTSIAHSVAYYLEADVPAAKLGVGSGFYGTCYRNVSAPRVPVPGNSIVASDGAMSYRNIVALYQPAMSAHYDATAQAPWLSAATGQGPQQCTYVTYEDAQSIVAKGAWVQQQGLGGTIIWTISQAHFPAQPAGQRDPLLEAMRDGFLSPPQ